jgi:hypothetical protein
MGTRTPCASSSSTTLVNRPSCQSGYEVSSPPLAWGCAQTQVRQIEHRADRLHRLLGRHAQALEPHVDLDEDVARLGRRLGVGPRRIHIDERRDQLVSQRIGGSDR